MIPRQWGGACRRWQWGCRGSFFVSELKLCQGRWVVRGVRGRGVSLGCRAPTRLSTEETRARCSGFRGRGGESSFLYPVSAGCQLSTRGTAGRDAVGIVHAQPRSRWCVLGWPIWAGRSGLAHQRHPIRDLFGAFGFGTERRNERLSSGSGCRPPRARSRGVLGGSRPASHAPPRHTCRRSSGIARHRPVSVARPVSRHRSVAVRPASRWRGVRTQ